MGINYYEILGVSFDTLKDEILSRYQEILSNGLIYHSDEYKDEIESAFYTLYDDNERVSYDEQFTADDINKINLNY